MSRSATGEAAAAIAWQRLLPSWPLLLGLVVGRLLAVSPGARRVSQSPVGGAASEA